MAEHANAVQTGQVQAGQTQAGQAQDTLAGTDLGRRIAEQREHANLTVDTVAERAGMAPQYLRHLETSPRRTRRQRRSPA
jgi:AraC-like DNA-binding protein